MIAVLIVALILLFLGLFIVAVVAIHAHNRIDVLETRL